MINLSFIRRIVISLVLSAFGLTVSGQNNEFVTYEGRLEVRKNESAIIYLGKESGDLAAFCFSNKSAVGRAILSKCKNGQLCKFTGKVDFNKTCNIEGGMFSAEGKIISVKSVRKSSGFVGGFAPR